ncbi:GLPGLI family protein [Altibacter sp.]|uniref:GLPGLI family protein n=1 Tax=Altibacter sp. TaxID=2024823 RepID=UPI0025889D0A|nr:GLPGLI family protein [Altibacter sp.]MCW9036776.1 GLPGLI family protein [Altibacter sp.]
MLLKHFLFIFFMILSFGSAAQEFNGIATYKTDRKVDLKMSDDASDAVKEQLAAQLRKQFQKEYALTFTANESLYKEVESLEKPQAASTGGINVVVRGNTDVLYRNISENLYLNATEIMDKPFLIRDTLQKPQWELQKETKNIGEYTCFKAISSREVTEQIFDSATDSLVEVKKNQITTAWYTLDIPVLHGPDNYWGLPGLILEVNDGDLTILCSRIVMNPEKGMDLERPKAGKEVSQAEYDVIRDKKSKEMMEQFQSSGRREKGKDVQIRIGG